MATKKSSAEKRHAQSEVRRMRNKAVKSEVHTFVRKYVEAVQAKDENLAKDLLKTVQGELDVAYRKGVITRNASSRKMGRMTRLFNKTFAAK